MPLKTIISHVPDMRYVTLYSDYLLVTSSAPNAAAAAAILSVLEFWTKIKLGSNEQAVADALAKGANGADDVDLWVWRTHAELSEDMASVFSESTIRRQIEWLVESALIETRNNPHNKWDRKIQYRLNIDLINEMFRHVNPRFVQVTKWIFSSDNIEWVMWKDDLYQHNISLDKSPSSASDDAVYSFSVQEEKSNEDTSTLVEVSEEIRQPKNKNITPAAAQHEVAQTKPTSKPKKAKSASTVIEPKALESELRRRACIEVIINRALSGQKSSGGRAARYYNEVIRALQLDHGLSKDEAKATVTPELLTAFYDWFTKQFPELCVPNAKLAMSFSRWWQDVHKSSPKKPAPLPTAMVNGKLCYVSSAPRDGFDFDIISGKYYKVKEESNE